MLTKKIIIQGQIQGVGFRPFIYRLAHRFHLNGWVLNSSGRVEIMAQGQPKDLDQFERLIGQQHPPLAQPRIESSKAISHEPINAFSILPSATRRTADIHVPVDYFTCNDCFTELMDPTDRRYRYPFINCTQCGPRYTLINKLPYDRPNTSMANFKLCKHCADEYHDPLDRRFHAQPVACEICGPKLSFEMGDIYITGNEVVLEQASQALNHGKILAVKGIGGYHIMCDARNETAVARLRAKKQRADKPFAVVFPWYGPNGLDALQEELEPTEQESQQLLDPSRPIVLIKQRADNKLAASINPGLNRTGAMLPYSPLHLLLCLDFNGPLVATSANFSGEPVITDNDDIEQRLSHIVDGFIHHNRPILRPADDTVIQLINDAVQPVRLGRGSAPLELNLPFNLPQAMLATGGHMKTTIALGWRNRLVISPHIGDLGNARSRDIFQQVTEDLQALYQVRARTIIHDAHPDYASTRWASDYAEQHSLNRLPVYHHHAHASSLCGDYPAEPRWLIFAWDGTGLGEDNTLWGGETLYGHSGHWQRLASFKPMQLVGGDKVALQPWRSALSVCLEANIDWRANDLDMDMLTQAWHHKQACITSSAAGRLFDAAAALILNRYYCSYDGQAPMELEHIASDINAGLAIPLPLTSAADDLLTIDWQPLFRSLATPGAHNQSHASTVFHSSMAMNIIDQVVHFHKVYGDFAIGLTGGVFQNKKLTEFVLKTLQQKNYRVYMPHSVPCNDGGLSYGQIIESHGLLTHEDN
ncbi:MAG: carbamoyltransferase HypF [Gammaproteobacteria bacterium]|nr:carbamoyltransferase HypF [Gammaproteobacteria bacterium]